MSSTSNIIPNPAAFGYYSSKYLLFKSVEYLNKNKYILKSWERLIWFKKK